MTRSVGMMLFDEAVWYWEQPQVLPRSTQNKLDAIRIK